MADYSYTFLTSQNKLSSLLGDSSTGSDNQYPIADRKEALNNAELAFAEDSECLLEYATGTVANMKLASPDDCLKIVAFYVDDELITADREVSIKDLGRLKDYSGDVPYYYVWQDGGTWYIYLLGNSTNVNGDTYKIYYVKKPTTLLDADGDVSILPIEYREAVAYKAAAELFLQVGQYSRAKQLLSVYSQFVEKAKKRARERYIDAELTVIDNNYFPASETDRAGT